jgi:prevent-host-death family protein
MLKPSLMQVHERLGDVLNHVAYGVERVVLLRRGKPVAAIASIEDLRRLDALEAAATPEVAHG